MPYHLTIDFNSLFELPGVMFVVYTIMALIALWTSACVLVVLFIKGSK